MQCPHYVRPHAATRPNTSPKYVGLQMLIQAAAGILQ